MAEVHTTPYVGGLLRRWSYDLRADDALAVLRLRRLARWQKIALGSWFFAGGATTALMPEFWAGATGSLHRAMAILGVVALQFGACLLAREVWLRIKSRQVIPRPRPAVFEEWVDCIACTDLATTDEIYLSHELIGSVLTTRGHIFIISGAVTLVIPARAFADRDDMTDLAQHLRKLSQPPYYFDAPLDEDAAAP